MTLLPIVERELRVRSRQPLTYWTRGILALIAIFHCLQQLSYAEVFSSTVGAGQVAFRGLAVMAFVICSFGFLATADAISQERRENTLGLLLLTGIRAGDVLLGKLLSSWLIQTVGLLAFVPVLMLPVLAGGVSAGEALLTALALSHAMFCALAFGLWASACHSEWFRAVRMALLWLLAWWFAPWILDRVCGMDAVLGLLSPLTALTSALKNEPRPCAMALGLGQLIGWSILWRTRSLLRQNPAERETLMEKPVAEIAPREHGSLFLHADADFALTAPAFRNNPLGWLLRRQRGVLAMIWVATLLSVCGQFSSFWFYLFQGAATKIWILIWPATYVFSVVTGAMLAWAASRFLYEARRSGEMEMLLTTPVGAGQLISAHWAYLKRLLRWPVLLLVVLVLGQHFLFIWHSAGAVDWLVLAVMVVVAVANIVVGMAALGWAGMYFGWRSRSQLVAVVLAVGLMKGVPYLIYFFWRAGAGFFGRFPTSAMTVQLIYSLLPNLVVIGFWVWMIVRLRRKLLAGNLGLMEAGPTSWMPSFLRGKTWRQIRYWTPAS